jgi:hypothetical protein
VHEGKRRKKECDGSEGRESIKGPTLEEKGRERESRVGILSNIK